MNLDVLEAQLAAARALAVPDWPAAARALRQMVLTQGILIVVQDRLLAVDGVLGPHTLSVPLVLNGETAATVVVYANAGESLPEALVHDVMAWAGEQLESAGVVHPRQWAATAELRLLRAQMSPHFIYSALSSICSLVRTDPGQARTLLQEFADFTRHSFRRFDDSTTLADELRAIHQYLMLHRAQFGERLKVTFQVDPEVLEVPAPHLCLQPLVENAVQHGVRRKAAPGHIQIHATDGDADAVITIEDDGVGMDPEMLRQALAGRVDGIGMSNVDHRLRYSYGEEYGLVVETAPGCGMKVVIRIPKPVRSRTH